MPQTVLGPDLCSRCGQRRPDCEDMPVARVTLYRVGTREWLGGVLIWMTGILGTLAMLKLFQWIWRAV